MSNCCSRATCVNSCSLASSSERCHDALLRSASRTRKSVTQRVNSPCCSRSSWTSTSFPPPSEYPQTVSARGNFAPQLPFSKRLPRVVLQAHVILSFVLSTQPCTSLCPSSDVLVRLQPFLVLVSAKQPASVVQRVWTLPGVLVPAAPAPGAPVETLP